MSEKRMFAKSIVLSDAFLDMPATTRCLYFTLSMLADDEGFINSPKSIMRQCGATDDDFKILMAKYFIIPFETGIVVIRHWHINNYLRSDRFTPTKCTEERKKLKLEDGVYKEANEVQEIPAKKTRLPLLEREPKNEMEEVEKLYLLQYRELYESGVLQSEKPVLNWTQTRKLLKDCIASYGRDLIIKAVEKSKDDKFCVSGGYCLSTVLSSGVLARLINVKKGGADEFTVSDIDF